MAHILWLKDTPVVVGSNENPEKAEEVCFPISDAYNVLQIALAIHYNHTCINRVKIRHTATLAKMQEHLVV